MRIAIIGGGVAGALLGWRLRQASRRVAIHLFTGGRPAATDATGASGGMVRGYETAAQSCQLAAASLAEIRDSATLREWSGYQEIGSVYLLSAGVDPAESVRMVDRLLPGSITVVPVEQLVDRYPFRELAT